MTEEPSVDTLAHHCHERGYSKGEKLKRSECTRMQNQERSERKSAKEVEERKEDSFTMSDVEQLIGEAQWAAALEEGSLAGWRQVGSHDRHEFKASKEEGSEIQDSHAEKELSAEGLKGSGLPKTADFHFESERVQNRIRALLTSLRSECTVGELGGLVNDVLNILEPTTHACRSRSTTRKYDIFPLPVPGHNLPGYSDHPFLQALVGCLNSLHSCGEAGRGDVVSPSASMVLKRLEKVVSESHILDEKLPCLDFDSFFSQRGLDYTGDEIRLAQPISWPSVEASLPPEAGSLDIRDFCSGGILHFVNNIEETIIPLELQQPMRCPSTMVCEGDWELLARGLVDRGLCKIMSEDQLYYIGNQPLLNGLFSVGKDEIRNQIPVSRLIMNLKPWNAISRSLAAEVGTLPSITQMNALYLHDGDVLVTSSEDLRCFFYLFRVPEAWCRFMGFGREIPRSMVPPGGEGKKWYLCGTVLPMGYLNSAGIAQHIHRAVILKALGSMRGLGKTVQEIRRDKVFTNFSNLFRVYLDNFDQLQKLDKATAYLVSGSCSELVEQIREFYAQRQLPRHPKKSVEQALGAEVQGAWVDGEAGTISAKPSKVAKYIRLALEIIGRGKASQRELQVVGGGFVYIAMFRRPLLSSLNQIWRTIVEEGEPSPHAKVPLRREVLIELVRFIGLCPLSFINLRGQHDEMVTASDASTTGGYL